MDHRLSFIQLHAKNQHNKPQQRLFVLALVEWFWENFSVHAYTVLHDGHMIMAGSSLLAAKGPLVG